jgi:hypothetical protein
MWYEEGTLRPLGHWNRGIKSHSEYVPAFLCLCYSVWVEVLRAGRVISQALSLRLQPWRFGFEPRSGYMGFVVDKMTLGQVSSEYVGFPCRFSFHRQLSVHHHLSSGAGIIDQLVADVPNGLSPTPPQETKKKMEILQWVNFFIQRLLRHN